MSSLVTTRKTSYLDCVCILNLAGSPQIIAGTKCILNVIKPQYLCIHIRTKRTRPNKKLHHGEPWSWTLHYCHLHYVEKDHIGHTNKTLETTLKPTSSRIKNLNTILGPQYDYEIKEKHINLCSINSMYTGSASPFCRNCGTILPNRRSGIH